MKKKIFVILLLPIFLIGVVGCGNETAKKENKKEEQVESKENIKIDKDGEEQVENKEEVKIDEEQEGIINSEYEPKCFNNVENVYYSKNFDETIYESVASYLKAQKNIEGKIIVPTKLNSETNEFEKITKELTNEEIEIILSEIEEKVRSTSGGIGGATFIGMILNYEKDGNNMEVAFYGSKTAFVTSNDGDFIKLLDYQLGDDYENLQGFCNYIINTGTTVNGIIEQLKVENEG